MRRSLALALLVAVAAAGNAFAVGEARISGTVTDSVTMKPIANAVVLVQASKDAARNFKEEVKADKDGKYAIFLIDGTIRYDFTWSAPGYTPYSENMKLRLGETNIKDVPLTPASAPVPATAKATIDPAIAAYNAGAALANDGKVDEAIAKIEDAVTMKPDLTAGFQALARLYLRKKDYPKAIDRASKALAIDPDDPDMNSILFESYTATGDTAKAAQFKAKMPANAGALFNDAAKLINSGKDGEAEPLLKQAIAANDKLSVAYYELGMLYVRSQKNADAKTNLQKYLELDPNGKDAATAKEMLKYLQ